MNKIKLRKLKKISKGVRKDLIKEIYIAKSGHPLGSLSSVEIFVSLYYLFAKNNPKNPNWVKRDRIFVSHGHTCPALYAVMARKGYFSKEKLKTYAKLGSSLQGHPEKTYLKGIETSSGSLGMGLGQAVGYALGARLDKKNFYCFVTTSDGEHEEGSHWEAVDLAAKYGLSKIIQIIDKNNIQISGTTNQVMPLRNLKEKYEAFGWSVFEADGHDFESLEGAYKLAKKENKKPSVIIANTIGGKGVSFMESNRKWHSRHPTKDEYKKAMKEIESITV